ncbi:uncharacterized protein LOC129570615 [Sitodiplosis mosellana]|uniref:uncharacterized protein LOC129570615 n=1 Tax=Sitodiplosis mosellana TaxID=263140 RepID=UPI002443EB1E|nr:uncharacterized protein LOC129570615 [Sitodiplosis mosellana]
MEVKREPNDASKVHIKSEEEEKKFDPVQNPLSHAQFIRSYNHGHGQRQYNVNIGEMHQMRQMYDGPMLAGHIKQEVGEVCEIEEKRYRISRQVQWNQGIVRGPINMCDPSIQLGASMMSSSNRSAYQFQRIQPEPKMLPATVLSTLEANVKSLIEDAKSTCEAFSNQVKTNTESHGKEIAGYRSTIAELTIQRDALVLERDLANLEKTEIKNAMLELKTNLEAKLETEYDNAVAQIRVQHVIDLEREKEQFSAQIDSLKKKLSEEVAEKQAAIEAKDEIEEELEIKYQKIVAGIKAKAELNRTQLMEQGKVSTCGAVVKYSRWKCSAMNNANKCGRLGSRMTRMSQKNETTASI